MYNLLAELEEAIAENERLKDSIYRSKILDVQFERGRNIGRKQAAEEILSIVANGIMF